MAVVEPDRRIRFDIDWGAEDLSELFHAVAAEPYLDVWLVTRRGRTATARTGVAATLGYVPSAAAEARRRSVSRTDLRLAARGSAYEFPCRHCRARPRVAAAALRQAARQALGSRRPARLLLWPNGSLGSADG